MVVKTHVFLALAACIADVAFAVTESPSVQRAIRGVLEILVSYDHNRNTKSDEILLARFTEDEVLRGELNEPTSFLRKTVFRETP